MRHVTSALWLGLTLAACSSKPDAPPPPQPGSAGSAAVTPPAASTAALVEVFVNDKSVAKVTAAQVAEWPRLDSLVPPENRKLGQWGAITLTGADGKPVELQKPFDTYPDMVPAIFPTGAGAGFGMYDAVELAKRGTAGMHQDNLKSIKIAISDNGHGGNDDNNEVGDPTKLVLTFKTPAGSTQVPGAKLLALPREPMPGGGESKGWKLGSLLAAGGVTTFEKLLLSDAAGANLVLEKADFDEKTSVPFVKLNKKGLLRVTVYKKKGEGWTPGADLRALSSVEVTK